MKKIYILFITIILFSCEENKLEIENTDNLLIGNWTNAIYENETTSFSRANELPKDNYGISFKVDGSLVEKTSGWCGTPPLSFFNLEGNYQLKDSLITIFMDNYSYAWRIISLTETNLVVKRELSEQEIVHRELMDLYNEILNLAYSVSCSKASDWLFVGYGAKACGGFQGYIPYSKEIDTVAFLEKITVYNELEAAYNKQFDIFSDCLLIPTPKSVSCKNNYPVLNY